MYIINYFFIKLLSYVSFSEEKFLELILVIISNQNYQFFYIHTYTHIQNIQWKIFFQTVDNPETTEEVVEPQTAPSDDLEIESMDVESEKNEEVAPEEYRPPSPTMDADIPQADEQNTVSQTEFATKSPLKWTVSYLYL